MYIANMTKKIPFNPFGLENIIAFIPLAVHFACSTEEQSKKYEPLATYVCMALMFCLFFGHIYLLSMQWLAYQKGTRRWWTIDLPKK